MNVKAFVAVQIVIVAAGAGYESGRIDQAGIQRRRYRWNFPAEGDQADAFPDGSYRHFWYMPRNGTIAGLGIHGQWLWVDRPSATVIARTASEDQPTGDDDDRAVGRMMRAICAA